MKLSKSLTITFFAFLTLSLGVMFTNYVAESVYAQSNTLAQNGGGNEANQNTRQSQSSTQDNQVLSGDSSILSGNNVLCQIQDNVLDNVNEDSLCILEEAPSNPPPLSVSPIGPNVLTIYGYTCSTSCNTATITVSDSTGSQSFKSVAGGEPWTRQFIIPIGDKYTVTVDVPFPTKNKIYFDRFLPINDCKQVNINSCSGIMGDRPQSLNIHVDRDV